MMQAGSLWNKPAVPACRSLFRADLPFFPAQAAAQALLLFALSSTAGFGQDAVRMSMASSEAARARRQAAETLGYYNVKMGPTGWKFGTTLEADFEDNVNLTRDDEADVVLRPFLNANMLWPLTEKNVLSLGLGAGYSYYLEHSRLSHFDLAPGTELSLDAYAGDFWFNFHDRASALQSAYQDPTVAGQGGYSRLENDLGLTALWDLNKVILKAEYDHINYVPISDGKGTVSGSSEVFSGSGGYSLEEGFIMGAELGGSLLSYSSGSPYSGGRQWNAGAFTMAPLGDYINLQAHLGYTVFSPDGARTNAISTADISGLYAQLVLTHRLNRVVTYNLSGGRSISSAYASGAVDLYSVALMTEWHLLEHIPLTAGTTYEHGKQTSFETEEFDRYGAILGASRTLTENVSCAARYQYYYRASNIPNREYTANILSLSLTYNF